MGAFSTFDIAGSALSAQSLRLNVTASNLANMHNVAGDPTAVVKARAPKLWYKYRAFPILDTSQGLSRCRQRLSVPPHGTSPCAPLPPPR